MVGRYAYGIYSMSWPDLTERLHKRNARIPTHCRSVVGDTQTTLRPRRLWRLLARNVGAIATHVDDTLSAVTERFEEESKVTAQSFDAKPRRYDTLKFAGVTMETNKDGSRLMHQSQYASKIEPLSKGYSYEQFRSRRHELAWIMHTRPHVAATVSILAQVTKDSLCATHITQINKRIQLIKKEPRFGLKVHQLDMHSFRIISHADASFSNLQDVNCSWVLVYYSPTRPIG